LELAHHPLHNGETYNEYAGNEALHRHGKKKWNRRVLKMIDIIESLLNYDVLYLGGGNARHLTLDLPPNVRTASNENGITGGVHLWDETIWHNVRGGSRRPAAPIWRQRGQAAFKAQGANADVRGKTNVPGGGAEVAGKSVPIPVPSETRGQISRP